MVNDFLKEVQAYYGMKYDKGTLRYLVGYLEKQKLRYDILLKETFKTFSGQYKTLPDIAIFEKVKNEYLEGKYKDMDLYGVEVYGKARELVSAEKSQYLGYRLTKNEELLINNREVKQLEHTNNTFAGMDKV